MATKTNNSLNPDLAGAAQTVRASLKKEQDIAIDIITGVLLARLVGSVLNKLDEKQKREFDKIIIAKDENKIGDFLRKNIKNYEKFLGDEINEFQAELTREAKKLVKA